MSFNLNIFATLTKQVLTFHDWMEPCTHLQGYGSRRGFLTSEVFPVSTLILFLGSLLSARACLLTALILSHLNIIAGQFHSFSERNLCMPSIICCYVSELSDNLKQILLWSQIEVNLAIISASGPALRPLFKKIIDNSSNRSQYGYGQSSGNVFQSRARGTTRGAIELQSYTGKNETTIKAGTPKEDDNNSQEYILQGRDENGQGGTGIVKTVVTSVESRASFR